MDAEADLAGSQDLILAFNTVFDAPPRNNIHSVSSHHSDSDSDSSASVSVHIPHNVAAIPRAPVRSMDAQHSVAPTESIYDNEDEDEWEVEQLLMKRVQNGVTEYYVRWMGWSDYFNSWIAEADLHCDQLINDYNAAL